MTTAVGMTGAMMTEPTEPMRAATPVADLAEMVGHYLYVRVTYQHQGGGDEHVEFVGVVTGVDPLVTVTQPGSGTPFTLPPDPGKFGLVAPSAFAPESLPETALSPRFETRWRVRAPEGAAHAPAPGPFRPRHG